MEGNATGCPPAMTETRSSSGLVVVSHLGGSSPPPINHPPGLALPPPSHFSSIDDLRVWAMGEGLVGLLAHSWPRKTSLRTGLTRHQRPCCHPTGDHPV